MRVAKVVSRPRVPLARSWRPPDFTGAGAWSGLRGPLLSVSDAAQASANSAIELVLE